MQRKIIYRIYICFALVLAVFTIILLKTYKVSESSLREDDVEKTAEFENYYDTVEENDGKEIRSRHYVFTVPDFPYGRADMVFYTSHQTVRVTVDDKTIYEFGIGDRYLIGSTPGYAWNWVILTSEDTGKKLELIISSPYEKNIDMVPDIYIGEKLSIYKKLLGSKFLMLILDVIMFLIGLIFIFSWVIRRKYLANDRRLLYLGNFAAVTALWIFFDSYITQLLFGNVPVIAYLTYFTLMLIPVPFVLYLGESRIISSKNAVGIICTLSFADILLVIILLLAKVMDLKESLLITHMYLAVLIVYAVFFVIRALLSKNIERNVKIKILCIGGCMLGCGIDLIRYYKYNGASQMIVGLSAFIIYTFVLGFQMIMNIRGLIAKGKLAGRYEELAYHDALTGMKNRTAYEKLISEIKNKNGCAIFMFDLNDLKKCNDNYGHESGDSYIINSSKIIDEVFGINGSCFRIGGDEFCAVISNVDERKCEELFEEFKRLILNCGCSSSKFDISVACGYAIYDENLDNDLNATKNRADEMMYRHKSKMKNI